MTKSREQGMRTFDWALFEIYNEGLVGYEQAIRNADSCNELRLNIKLKSQRGEPASGIAQALSLHQDPTPEEVETMRLDELREQQEKRDEFKMQRLRTAKAGQYAQAVNYGGSAALRERGKRAEASGLVARGLAPATAAGRGGS